mgnify:CR=1 FL=1
MIVFFVIYTCFRNGGWHIFFDYPSAQSLLSYVYHLNKGGASCSFPYGDYCFCHLEYLAAPE